MTARLPLQSHPLAKGGECSCRNVTAWNAPLVCSSHRLAFACNTTAPERPQLRASPISTPAAARLEFPKLSVAELDVPSPNFNSVPEALEAIAAGELVVVLDDANRENEGDLIIAADKVTPEKIAFMVEHTSGPDCDRLRLPLMVSSVENEEQLYTAFTVTCDLREGVTTGISASDRAKTVAALGNAQTTYEDLRRPGHIFPLRSREGGVLVRPGHTEAAVDLAYYAGCYPAGVLCEIVDRSTGEMARTPQLQQFAQDHGLKCVTIADLVRYRLKREVLLRATEGVGLSTRWGDFKAVSFESLMERQEHLVLVYGDVRSERPLVRIHQESLIGDVFGVELCSSQPEMDASMNAIVSHGSGVFIYLSRRAHSSTRIVSNLRHMHQLLDSCSVDGEAAVLSEGPLDVRDMGNVHSMLQGVRSSRQITLLTDDYDDLANLRAFGHDVEQMSLSALLRTG